MINSGIKLEDLISIPSLPAPIVNIIIKDSPPK